MLRRELVERRHDGPRIAAQRMIDILAFAPKSLCRLPVEPKIVRDAKHPSVQMSAGLALILARQSARTGLLHEIVALFQIPREAKCKYR
jgi:hypothetical protein